jgi:uncharacterized protein YacL
MTETMIPAAALIGLLVLILGVMRLRHVSIQGLMFGVTGAIIGLVLGALAAVPLSKLPGPVGVFLPIAVSMLLTVVMIVLLVQRRSALVAALPFLHVKHQAASGPAAPAVDAEAADKPLLPQILVDTSVIIDGRIADIATAGFVPGRLVVPRFVLAELQNIADSDDAMRRGRGRRGLDVLNTLRELPDVDVSIIEDDVQGVREVDAKLVALAQRFSCNVLTTDYNLNRVAQIQGVRVLNVNELSNAIRPVVLPGEQLMVRVVQPGKERNQGVGYLADGTMIVVENGDKLMGQEVATEVTRVFQTVAGKMIFAVPRGDLGSPTPSPRPVSPSETSADFNPASVPTPRVAEAPREQTPRAEGEPSTGRRSRGRSRGNGGGANRPQTDRANKPSSIEDRIISATQPDKSDSTSSK